MKKYILLAVILLLVPFSKATVLAATATPANSITTWRGNHPGALSLTFDDGYLTQYTFVLPAINARGFRGTFFVVTSWATWDWWKAAANAGHEIGAHTATHPDLTTLSASDAETEIATSQVAINTQIPSQKCVSFAYPYGALNATVEALAQKYFIGTRGVINGLNSPSTDLYNEFGYDVTYDTVSQMENLTDQAVSQGQWLIPIFHSFDPTQWGTWTTDMFLSYMDYLKGRTDLWIAPFGEVTRYMRERSAATISVSSNTNTAITLNLTDSLDNTTFNYPLTLRSVVPVNWAAVNVQQGTNVATLTPVTDGGQWVVYYDAVPDGGSITLMQGAITPPPVATNDAYSTVVNTSLNVPSPGVLGNDTNPSGATLTAQLVSGTSHGVLNLSSNGSFVYSPLANYVGSDSFTYMANDGTNGSFVATATITIASTGNVLFSDDFSRVANAPAPLSPWTVALGTWQIANGVLQGSSAPSTYASIYTYTPPLWTDYAAQAQVQFPAGAFGGGIGGRVNPTSGARYSAWVFPDGSTGGSNMLKLAKFRDWTTWNGTPMQQVSLPSVGTGWHALKMVFNSSRIQVFYDGTLMIDVTDNNYDSLPPYLSGGISGEFWTNTSSYAMGLDNVVVSTSGGIQYPVAANDAYSTPQNTPLAVAAPGVLNNDTAAAGATLTAQLVSGPSHGTLTLNGNGSFAFTPAANYAGSDSFTYTANDGTNSSNAATVTIAVLPAPALSALSLNPTSVVGGATSQGTLTLSGPAPSGGAVVQLSSDNTSAASVPASVTIPSGSTSAKFTITTTAVANSTAVTITAVYGGVTKTATLTVNPPVLSTLSLNPTRVTGGSISRGTVTLSGPAPSGGVVVSLSGNSTAAGVPASVTVPSGSTNATFTISTTAVTSSTAVTITAVYGGVTKTAALTVNPPVLSTLSLSPTKVTGGSTSRGMVTLSGPAPSGGVVVSLSANSTAASVPVSITVPSGSTSATFTITTVPVASSTAVTITAVYGGVTKTARLTVS